MPVLGQFTDDDGDGRISAGDDPDVAYWLRDDSVPGTSNSDYVLADAGSGAVHRTQRIFNGSRLGIAAGDLDGDGETDLVYTSGSAIARVSDGGRIVWSVTRPSGLASLGLLVGLADLDQDGRPEIHLAHVVWDFEGNHLWTGSRSTERSPSVAADIDPSTPGMELVVGNVLYAADGTVLWEAATEPEGHTAVGDLDGDLDPEIVLLAHEWLEDATLTVLDARGEIVGERIPLGSRAETEPIIAELDGLAGPEVVLRRSVGGASTAVLAFTWEAGTLAPLWEAGLVGDTGPTPPTAFDFDGDGRHEVVVGDEAGVVILDGATGAELARLPNESITQDEIPVVADADGDGVTEIFAPACGTASFVPDPLYVLFQCASPCVARAAWNQSSYRIGNVGLDGTIPRFEPPPWLSHGTWGAQGGTGPCDLHCDAAVAPSLPDFETCAGESVTLDASGHDIRDCDGTVTRAWSDETGTPLGTGPTLEVAPLTTTRYRVDLTCSTRPSCRLADAATVHVSERPELGPATATDVAPCNRGVEITWPEADFTTGFGGTYSIYRSDLATGGTCEDALAQPALATGLTGTSWFDADTLAGVAHVWVVEAEDDRPAGGCLPAGPGGGSVARSCVGPLEDVVELDPPEGVFATLRVERDGAENRARWSDARALVSGEHFHLHRSDDPRVFGPIVNPEGDTAREHLLDAEPVPLRVFDLRVADVCERESPDEFPPGWDVP